MSEIKKIRVTKNFENSLKHVKDKKIFERLKKQLQKIKDNPEVGKPLRNILKGERTVYIKPYRLIYKVDDKFIYLLRFQHRKEAYRSGI